MTNAPDPQQLLRAKLNGETASMPWKELLRYFAAGNVVAISPDLDLIEVAACMSNDNAAAIAQWMAENRIAKVSDAQAQAWLEADAACWTVVVRPWILVQERVSARS